MTQAMHQRLSYLIFANPSATSFSRFTDFPKKPSSIVSVYSRQWKIIIICQGQDHKDLLNRCDFVNEYRRTVARISLKLYALFT